jgi:hypothetical protein
MSDAESLISISTGVSGRLPRLALEPGLKYGSWDIPPGVCRLSICLRGHAGYGE